MTYTTDWWTIQLTGELYNWLVTYTTDWWPTQLTGDLHNWLYEAESPSREANSSTASQEIPGILWNQKIHYRVRKAFQQFIFLACWNISTPSLATIPFRFFLHHTSLHYIALRCVVLCCYIIHYIMLCYVVLCYCCYCYFVIILRYFKFCYIIIYYIISYLIYHIQSL